MNLQDRLTKLRHEFRHLLTRSPEETEIIFLPSMQHYPAEVTSLTDQEICEEAIRRARVSLRHQEFFSREFCAWRSKTVPHCATIEELIAQAGPVGIVPRDVILNDLKRALLILDRFLKSLEEVRRELRKSQSRVHA